MSDSRIIIWEQLITDLMQSKDLNGMQNNYW